MIIYLIKDQKHTCMRMQAELKFKQQKKVIILEKGKTYLNTNTYIHVRK